jgi:hypothetical protein
MKDDTYSIEGFFQGAGASRRLFDALREAVEQVGAVQMRVTKSQVAFYRRRAFAWAWMPGKYLGGRGAPLVLTLALSRRDPAQRWKQVVEPSPGRFIHHLEIYSSSEIDAEVSDWIKEAWQEAV